MNGIYCHALPLPSMDMHLRTLTFHIIYFVWIMNKTRYSFKTAPWMLLWTPSDSLSVKTWTETWPVNAISVPSTKMLNNPKCATDYTFSKCSVISRLNASSSSNAVLTDRFSQYVNRCTHIYHFKHLNKAACKSRQLQSDYSPLCAGKWWLSWMGQVPLPPPFIWR